MIIFQMPFVCENRTLEEPIEAYRYIIRTFELSHANAQRAIARGRLFCNDKCVQKPSQIIHGAIAFIYFKPTTRGLKPIIVKDDFVLFDKPSGLIMHPQNRHTPYSLVDEVKYQYGLEANITHRLDMETSGLVLCATKRASEKVLKALFENRNITKSYYLAVRGQLTDDFTVDEPLLPKQSSNAKIRKLMQIDKEGKHARTDFICKEYLEDIDITILEAKPQTGRMHQIRAHMFHVKHPILGDPLYGQSEENVLRYLEREMSDEERLSVTGASRLLLHAYALSFEYNQKPYRFESPVDFEAVVRESM